MGECPQPESLFCTEDVKECDDGSFVSRNPLNNCEFNECRSSPMMCTKDVQECDDGSFVSRDPWNNCNFEACKTSTAAASGSSSLQRGSFASVIPAALLTAALWL